jgi:hypothetical protein
VDYRGDEFVFEPLPPVTPASGSAKRDGKEKTKVETVGVN